MRLASVVVVTVLSSSALAADSSDAAMVATIRKQLKARDYDGATASAEKCVAVVPRSATCHKLAGSAFASMGDVERSRSHYEQFLTLADPNDEAVPKVRALLGLDPMPAGVRVSEPSPPKPLRRAEETSKRLALTIGASSTLAVTSVIRVAVGDPKIADVSVVDATHLRVTGKSSGATSVVVWSEGEAQTSWDVEVK